MRRWRGGGGGGGVRRWRGGGHSPSRLSESSGDSRCWTSGACAWAVRGAGPRESTPSDCSVREAAGEVTSRCRGDRDCSGSDESHSYRVTVSVSRDGKQQGAVPWIWGPGAEKYQKSPASPQRRAPLAWTLAAPAGWQTVTPQNVWPHRWSPHAWETPACHDRRQARPAELTSRESKTNALLLSG